MFTAGAPREYKKPVEGMQSLQNLNPTLWRTCKMLAGTKRVQLLRQLQEQPGRCVSDLGKAVGVKRSDASQELRRIQSRGLLKSKRHGVPLVYRLEADPQVSSAAPLLKAIQVALAAHPPERDLDICTIANGLANERRIAIVRALMASPQTRSELHTKLNVSAPACAKHLRTLLNSGFAEEQNRLIHFRVPAHPVARALAKLIVPAK